MDIFPLSFLFSGAGVAPDGTPVYHKKEVTLSPKDGGRCVSAV